MIKNYKIEMQQFKVGNKTILVPIESFIYTNEINELKGWKVIIEPSRWNWSCYIGWFLTPKRKGIFAIIDKIRELLANI